MKKLPIEKVTEIIKEAVKDIKFLSTEEKLEVRNLQLAFISAKNQLTQAENQLGGYINNLAAKLELSPNDVEFDINSLTFVPRKK